MKSSNLLETMLLSKNFPSLHLFSVPPCKAEIEKLAFDFTCLEERIPIFIFLQRREYKANVPPEVVSVIITSGYFASSN